MIQVFRVCFIAMVVFVAACDQKNGNSSISVEQSRPSLEENAANTSVNIQSAELQEFAILNSGLFGDSPTLDVYSSKGPKWREDLLGEVELQDQAIKDFYDDEADNAYHGVLPCVEEQDGSMEDFEIEDIKVNYQFYAVKDKKKMDAYIKKERRTKPKTVAYGLQPLITMTYSTQDTTGTCKFYHHVEYYFYTNDKENITYIGSLYTGDDYLEPAEE